MTAVHPVFGHGIRRQTIGAAVLLLASIATVGTALLFEHAFGYIPCALCLQERIPYYVAICVSASALVLSRSGASTGVVRGLIALVGLLMVWSLYLAVYHAGVEWHWWAGPTDCVAAGGADLTGDLLSTIDAIHPPACDQAAGRFLGLSFAGWNAIASAIIGGFAFAIAGRRARR